jgi:hypothetical protein
MDNNAEVETFPSTVITLKYSRTPLIGINWDGEPSRYAENPVTGLFFDSVLHLAVSSSAVTIYSMYLRLNFSTTPDLTF